MGEGTVLVPLRSETYRFGEGEREPFRTESRRDRGERGRPFLVRRHPLPPETATYEFSCVGAGNVFVGGNGQGTPREWSSPGRDTPLSIASRAKKISLVGRGVFGVRRRTDIPGMGARDDSAPCDRICSGTAGLGCCVACGEGQVELPDSGANFSATPAAPGAASRPLGSWMLNGLGSLRVRVSAEDLAGVWSEGEVLSKKLCASSCAKGFSWCLAAVCGDSPVGSIRFPGRKFSEISSTACKVRRDSGIPSRPSGNICTIPSA